MNEWNEALVLKYNESAISTFLLGSGKMNTEKMTSFLNFYLKDGYTIKAVEKENRRMFLFFKRESFIIFLEKRVKLI
jgi:hypothetical protein